MNYDTLVYTSFHLRLIKTAANAILLLVLLIKVLVIIIINCCADIIEKLNPQQILFSQLVD